MQSKSGSLAVTGGREIAPVINELLSLPFVVKIATQDWHPSDHVSFNTSHESSDVIPFESKVTIRDPENSEQSLEIPIWPVHCVQDTHGAEIIPEIDITKIDHVVRKGRDKRVEMFSGFFTCFGAKSDAASHDLGALLKEANISHVIVAGIAGDFCVRCTAMDAKREGFTTYVVEEATRSVDPSMKGWGAVKRELDEAGIQIVSIEGPELGAIRGRIS